MILSDRAIRDAMIKGDIVIDPFDANALGGNSYDVHLADTLLVHTLPSLDKWYGPGGSVHPVLDAAQPGVTHELVIPPEGLVLEPEVMYLASTVEYTETHRHVPYLDGKSSIGRLGIAIHLTAGRGDVGFCNHWTMEIAVVHPVRVYAGMPIGQLTYHTVEGQVLRKYDAKPGAKYNARDPKPQASQMWRNFRSEK